MFKIVNDRQKWRCCGVARHNCLSLHTELVNPCASCKSNAAWRSLFPAQGTSCLSIREESVSREIALLASKLHGNSWALQVQSHLEGSNMTSEHTLKTLNSLLRGEIAATETYQQAFAKLGDDPMTMNLRQIHVDHREAANELRQHVHSHGGKPDQGSGAWGAFAKVFEGTAKTFGAATAIKALKEGEEHGKADY